MDSFREDASRPCPAADRSGLRRLATPLVIALAIGLGPPAAADDDDPARVPPQAASIDAVLAAIQRDFPGRVLKVKLERDDHGGARWLYEVKVLTDAGNVVELELDAVSLEVLRAEGGRAGRSGDD